METNLRHIIIFKFLHFFWLGLGLLVLRRIGSIAALDSRENLEEKWMYGQKYGYPRGQISLMHLLLVHIIRERDGLVGYMTFE